MVFTLAAGAIERLYTRSLPWSTPGSLGRGDVLLGNKLSSLLLSVELTGLDSEVVWEELCVVSAEVEVSSVGGVVCVMVDSELLRMWVVMWGQALFPWQWCHC